MKKTVTHIISFMLGVFTLFILYQLFNRHTEYRLTIYDLTIVCHGSPKYDPVVLNYYERIKHKLDPLDIR